MDKVEMIRVALAEIGDVSAEELTAFAMRRFGVQINPKIVPVLKATLCDRERIAAKKRERAMQAQTGELQGQSGPAGVTSPLSVSLPQTNHSAEMAPRLEKAASTPITETCVMSPLSQARGSEERES